MKKFMTFIFNHLWLTDQSLHPIGQNSLLPIFVYKVLLEHIHPYLLSMATFTPQLAAETEKDENISHLLI